jgi:transcriptional regulator with XRE-family HTH domain
MTQGHGQPATLSDLVAEEIRVVMARRKLSARGLADLLGVSPSWVSYRLNSKQVIDLNELERIATALNVPFHSLLPTETQRPTQPIRPKFHHPVDPRKPRPKPTKLPARAPTKFAGRARVLSL